MKINDEKRREIVSYKILKQIKKYHQYDKKLAIWENKKLKKKKCDQTIIDKIEKRINDNNKIINYKFSKELDCKLITIIKKVSPVFYEDISDDILNLYMKAINAYFNYDVKTLINIVEYLEFESFSFKEIDLNDVLIIIKLESKTSNFLTYYHIKKELIKKNLTSLEG